MTSEADVARCLLGTWPDRVAKWGEDGIAAYLSELTARGVSWDEALVAIRSYDPGADFPPSVAKLAQQARRDPGRPTADEALRLVRHCLAARASTVDVYAACTEVVGRKEARERLDVEAILGRAGECHSLVAAFVRDHLTRLRCLDLEDGAPEPWDRKEFGEMWERFVEASEGREVAALVSGRRGELSAFDPLRVLKPSRVGIGAGERG